MGNQFINNFQVNGKTYYTGTIFIINYLGKEAEASFICYDLEHSLFIFQIKHLTCRAHDTYFYNNFICATNKIDKSVRMPIIKKRKDFEINGLFIGWIWYIFLMLISIIFKDAIGLWIIISIVFFSWRSKKIKEEGTYVEW